MGDVLVLHDAAAPPGTLDVLFQMLPPLAICLTVWWLFVLRPQQQETAARDAALAALTKGDEVVTSGGLYGRIIALDANVITVEIAEKTHIRVDRSAISRKVGTEPPVDKK